MGVTWNELNKGDTVTYTYHQDGRVTTGKVLEVTNNVITVIWDDEHSSTEYGVNDTLVDFNHMDIVTDKPKKKTGQSITREQLIDLVRYGAVMATNNNEWTYEDATQQYELWKSNLNR